VTIHPGDVRVSTKRCTAGGLNELAIGERQQSFDPEPQVDRERVQA
jgi:hypothetical protein